jgi:hypothetical protein
MSFGKRQPAGYRGVERRRAVREKADISAHIILPASQFVKCRITDHSSIGAWLIVPSAFGRNYHVRVVQRGIGNVGVEFV